VAGVIESRESAGRSPIELLFRLLTEAPDWSVIGEPDAWNAVRTSAGRFGVATLIAFIGRSRVPAAERKWCDEILAGSWGHHERSLRDLDWIAGLLAAEGISAMALKGPLLARRHYNPAFLRRPSFDLDIAVRHADLERACQILVRAGYRLHMSVAETKLRSHHVELSHAERLPVELHFHLSHGPYGIPVDGFLDRAVRRELPSGRAVHAPDQADEIVHLALHFAHSSAITLFHLYEIHRIWVAATPDVRREAARRASGYRCAGAFALLDAAFRFRWEESLLTPDMEIKETWLNFRLDRTFYQAFERRFTDQAGSALPFTTQLSRKWMLMQMTDRPADALRLALTSGRTAFLQFSSGRRSN
jgi:hypothetical protein